MAAQIGRNFKLQIDTTGAGNYVTIGGARVNSMRVNNQSVDITDKDSGGWQELLGDAGVSNISMSITGVFKDSAAEEAVRAVAFSKAVRNYKLLFPNGDTLTQGYFITDYERSADHDNAEQYSATLSSSGSPTYV